MLKVSHPLYVDLPEMGLKQLSPNYPSPSPRDIGFSGGGSFFTTCQPPQTEEPLTFHITTLNVENVHTNHMYMKQVADSCSILILQEHWLFSFEENDIFRYLPNHEGSITSVDSDDPISPYQRPRGYGGAAILWHATLSPHISTLKEKTARITAISITKVAIKDICIIGAYFPCRGLRESEAEFEDTLMQVAEICSKHIDTHFIIVAADFNADLRSSSSRSGKVKRTLLSLGLSLFDCPAQSTFYHHSDLGQSQIDYIIGSPDLDIHIDIHDRDPCNTSSHIPVTATLKSCMSYSQTSSGDGSPPSNAPKPRCDLIEPLTYKSTVLETLDGGLEISPLEEDIDRTTNHLVSVLVNSATAATPHLQKKAKKKDRPPWNAHISSCMHISRSAHVTWINAGRPLRGHPLSMERRDAKRLLRRAMRRENAQRRHDFYNRIMDSHSNRDKNFFRIIAKQRSHSTNRHPKIKVDGRLLTDPSEILDAWADHFDNLGTPLEDPTFDANYRSQVVEDMKCIFHLASLVVPPSFSIEEISLAIKHLNTNRAADAQGLMAEHLRNAPPTVVSYLRRLMNAMSVANYIPPSLCCGDLITIPKKGKDPLAMNNHCGITITSVLGKLLEHLLMSRVRALLRESQHDLQLGFTPGLSPGVAALICTEVQ